MQEPRKQLIALGLNESEVTVYLAMLAGSRTARDLIKTTGIKRPTVYYALGCLQKRGLISKSGREGDAVFTVESFKRLVTIAEEKENEARILTETIGELIPTLESELSPANQKPSVSFFEGTDAVKHVIMDMMYSKNKHIDCIAPQKNFFWGVSEDFVRLFITERKRRSIHTRNLWESEIDKKVLKTYYNELSEIRILPKVMQGKFKTTIFLYDDKTLYISSIKQSYCVLITSQEHHDTMRALFEGLWSASKPHTW
jgi:sugar-specific transcriptional regulator TrmB